jgi:endonuclease/exonuclease/phosphatase family metal-dependent hydrolase
MTEQGGYLHVMSWNLLAHEFTGYEAEHHRNKEAGQRSPKEHPGQFSQRCERARRIILDKNAAVVLLQEVSYSFLNDSSYGGSLPPSHSLDQLYCRYRVVAAFGDGGGGGGAREPGTAVLIRKDVSVVDQFVVPGSVAQTGGTSKSACGVCMQLRDVRAWAISIHTTWGGNAEASQKRLNHLQLLLDATTTRLSPGDAVVVGGDFNCSATDPQLSAIDASCCLAGLKRVALPGHTFTSGDGKSCCIDHFFLSAALCPRLLAAEVQPLLGAGQPCAHCPPTCSPHPPFSHRSSYQLSDPSSVGPAQVIGASDHAWIALQLNVGCSGSCPPS